MEKLWKRLLKLDTLIALISWAYQNIWLVLFPIGLGGLMTYLASITGWLTEWGPVAWGAVGIIVGIISALFFAFTYFLVALAKEKIALAKYASASITTSTVNPLAPSHSRVRIKLIEFNHPYFRHTKYVKFEDCEIYGPCSAVFQGCTFDLVEFDPTCEIVIIRNDRPIKGVVALTDCQLIRCQLFRVTLLMGIEEYKRLPKNLRAGMPVISDGRIGDI